MNRVEKRQMDRMETWFNSLSEDKKQKIYDVINEKINSNNNMMTAISDICTVCALDDVLDISLAKIREVIEQTKFYLIDYGEYLEKEGNGGIMMIENEALRMAVGNKIKKYIAGKMEKSKGLKLLKHEFNLPYGELSDLWIECKSYNEGYSKTPANPNVEVIMEYDNVNLENKKIEIITKPEKKISLKVVKVTTEIEGEYGHYVKSSDGVKIGDNLYSDKDMVKKEKVKVAANYNVKMDDIKAKIEELTASLKEIQDIGIHEMERFTELESVFDL